MSHIKKTNVITEKRPCRSPSKAKTLHVKLDIHYFALVSTVLEGQCREDIVYTKRITVRTRLFYPLAIISFKVKRMVKLLNLSQGQKYRVCQIQLSKERDKAKRGQGQTQGGGVVGDWGLG
jgi:hypothetical protein